MRPLRATTIAIAALLPFALTVVPAAAATKEQRMATCTFGADNDKLEGAKRKAFISKCMSASNYEPAARTEALKKGTAKPATAKPAAAPADEPETKPED